MSFQEQVGFAIGAIGAAAGFLGWYAQWNRQKYAAERDLSHLKNSQKQMADNMNEIVKEQDRRFDDLERQLITVISKLDNMMYDRRKSQDVS